MNKENKNIGHLLLAIAIAGVLGYVVQNIIHFYSKFDELVTFCTPESLPTACMVETTRGLSSLFALIVIFLPLLGYATRKHRMAKNSFKFGTNILTLCWVLWVVAVLSSVFLLSRISTFQVLDYQ